jgi:hypothetical protein
MLTSIALSIVEGCAQSARSNRARDACSCSVYEHGPRTRITKTARLASEIFLSSLQAELFSNLFVSCLRNPLNNSGGIPGNPGAGRGDPQSRNFQNLWMPLSAACRRTFVPGH